MSVGAQLNEVSPWKKLLQGAGWTATGQLVARGSVLVSGIVVARILTQEEFGKFGLLRSMVVVVTGIAAVGMATITTRSIATHARSDPERAGRLAALTLTFSLVTGVIVAVSLGFTSVWLAENQLDDASLGPAVIIVGLTAMLAVQQGTLSGVFVGLQNLRELAMIQVGAGLTVLPLVAIGARLGGVAGALLGLAAYQLILVLALHIRVRVVLAGQGIMLRWSESLREWRVIPTQALPLAIGSLMVTPAVLISQGILVNSDQGFAQVALFTVAMTWGALVMVPPGFIGRPLLPMISESRSDVVRLRRVLWHGGLMQFFAALATGLALVALSYPIMVSHGPEYEAGVPILLIVVAAYVLTMAASAADAAIQGAGNLWLGLGINVVWSLVFVGGSAVLGPGYGAVGLALSLLLAYGVKSVLQVVYLVWFLRRSEQASTNVLSAEEPSTA